MKRTLNRALLSFILFACSSAAAFACDQLPAGQLLWIRLTAPVTTYSAKPGDPVYSILTQDLVCDDVVILPMGAQIQGVVRSRHKVGWGIRHETATLELEFNRAVPGSSAPVALSARVEEVENARETVHKGVIQGIRSTNTFQGSINSRLIHLPTWNPYSDTFLIAYKAVFPIFPEPEIYYAAGTDMRLRTTTPIAPPPDTVTSVHEPAVSDIDQLDELVDEIPVRVTTKKNVNADLVNIVFLGTEEQVTSAFRVAGWHNADPSSRKSWFKNFYALLNNSGYAEQPMMTFLLNGKPEDMNWQKNLNSYGRRDHLRIWHWPSDEAVEQSAAQAVWVSSSTRDTRAVLSVKYEGFVHHIASNIDDERSTVIRDLNFAGCVKSVNYIDRPQMPTATRNATGDPMHTDGSIAVVALQECDSPNPEVSSNNNGAKFKPGNYVFRYIRKQILTFRNDIWRANIIYGAYDVARMTIVSMHRPPEERMPVASKPHAAPVVFPGWNEEQSNSLSDPASNTIF